MYESDGAFRNAIGLVAVPLVVIYLVAGALSSVGSHQSCTDLQLDAAVRVWQSGAVYAAVATVVMIALYAMGKGEAGKGILVSLGIGLIAGAASGIYLYAAFSGTTHR